MYRPSNEDRPRRDRRAVTGAGQRPSSPEMRTVADQSTPRTNRARPVDDRSRVSNLAGIIDAVCSRFTVRWTSAKSWAKVAEAAWQVLHEAGIGVNKANFVRRYPGGAVAIAQTEAGEIVGVLTLRIWPEGYNERFEAFHGLPGPQALITKSASPSQCAIREWDGC